MPLRPSQVETLRAVRQCDYGVTTAAMVGGIVNCTLHAGRCRLKALERSGYVHSDGTSNRHGLLFYRLTQLGREALEGRG